MNRKTSILNIFCLLTERRLGMTAVDICNVWGCAESENLKGRKRIAK